MKHSERFTKAVTKLYNAFHSGELNYFNCKQCAVGNMCDNNNEWADVFCGVESPSKAKTSIRFSAYEGKAKDVIDKTGYSPYELAVVESTFYINSCETKGRVNEELYFNALCAVIEYLCELEGIPNIMEYKQLFESAENKLETVFTS